MECENVSMCHFYTDEIHVDRGLGELQKEKYCEGDKTLCAIYQVASAIGKENVPIFPNVSKVIFEKEGALIFDKIAAPLYIDQILEVHPFSSRVNGSAGANIICWG